MKLLSSPSRILNSGISDEESNPSARAKKKESVQLGVCSSDTFIAGGGWREKYIYTWNLPGCWTLVWEGMKKGYRAIKMEYYSRHLSCKIVHDACLFLAGFYCAVFFFFFFACFFVPRGLFSCGFFRFEWRISRFTFCIEFSSFCTLIKVELHIQAVIALIFFFFC